MSTNTSGSLSCMVILVSGTLAVLVFLGPASCLITPFLPIVLVAGLVYCVARSIFHPNRVAGEISSAGSPRGSALRHTTNPAAPLSEEEHEKLQLLAERGDRAAARQLANYYAFGEGSRAENARDQYKYWRALAVRPVGKTGDENHEA